MDLWEFADKALDIPFVERGRGWTGVDCWGLVMLAHQEICGVELPDQINGYTTTRDMRTIARLMKDYRGNNWQVVNNGSVKALDVLLLSVRSRPCHVALVLEPAMKLMLHAEHERGIIVENWSRAPWRGPNYNNVKGIYRYIAD